MKTLATFKKLKNGFTKQLFNVILKTFFKILLNFQKNFSFFTTLLKALFAFVICEMCPFYIPVQNHLYSIFMRNSHDLNVVNSNNLALKVNGSDKYLPQNLFLLWELKMALCTLDYFPHSCTF